MANSSTIGYVKIELDIAATQSNFGSGLETALNGAAASLKGVAAKLDVSQTESNFKSGLDQAIAAASAGMASAAVRLDEQTTTANFTASLNNAIISASQNLIKVPIQFDVQTDLQNALTNASQNITPVKIHFDGTTAENEARTAIQNIQNILNSANITGNLTINGLNINAALDSIRTNVEDILNLMNQLPNRGGNNNNNNNPLTQGIAAYENRMTQLIELRERFNSYLNSSGAASGSQDYNTIQTQIQNLNALQQALESGTLTAQAFDNQFATIRHTMTGSREAINNSGQNFNNLNSTMDGYASKLSQLYGLQNRINTALKNYSAAANNAKTAGDYQNIQQAAADFEVLLSKFTAGQIGAKEFASEYNRLNGVLKNSTGAINKNGMAFKSFRDIIKDIPQYLQTYFTAARLVQTTIKFFKDVTNAAIEMQDAFVDLQIVTGRSGESFTEYASNLAKTAQDISVAATDLISATTTFARLGYSMEEAGALAEYTTMLEKAGSINAEDAQNAITSIIKAFNIDTDQIEDVMDKLVTVGNNFPISVEQIAEGMTNASSALAASGNSFEQSVALLTAANTTIQNASKSSTGLRTITARLRSTTVDLEELGEEMTTAQYEEIVNALTDYNVKLRDANGEFRSTYDIMSDIADKWSEMSSTEQAALANKIAGTRQQAVFFSIVEQFSEASEAMKKMESESSGALESAYSVYEESITAHVESLKSAFSGMSYDIVGQFSDLAISLIDIAKAAVDAIDGISKLTDGIGGLGTVIPGALMIKSLVSVIKSLNTQTVTFSSVLSRISLVITAVTLAYNLLNAAIDGYNKRHPTFEALKESAEEAAKSAEELSEQLNENKERIEELDSLSKSRSLSFADQEELDNLNRENTLLEIQYNIKKSLADLANEELARKARENISSGKYADAEVTDYTSKDTDPNQIIDAYWSNYELYISEMDAYQQALKENGGEENSYTKRLKSSYEEREKYLGDWMNYLNNYALELSNEIAVLDPNDAYDKVLIDQATNELNRISVVVGNSGRAIARINELTAKTQSSIMKAAESGTLTAESLYEMAGTDSEIQNLIDDLDTMGYSVDDIVSHFYSMVAEAENVPEAVSAAALSLSGLNKEREALDAVIDAQNSGESMTYELYQSLIAASNDYANCIEYENGLMVLNVSKANQLYDAKQKLTLEQVKYNKTIAEAAYKENAKRISELASSYADLNDELGDAAREELAGLIETNSEIKDKILSYSALETELTNATSAYQKWIDAQSEAESGDMYDDMIEAFEQINEGLTSGKTGVGNKKYTAAVELLIPEANQDDVKKYTKSLERYLTEDSSTGVKNFVQDMIDKGFAEGTVEKAVLRDGLTIQEICDGLTITPEMAKAIFGELQEYGATDLDMSFFADSVEDSLVVNLNSIDEIDSAIASISAEMDAIRDNAEGLTLSELDAKLQPYQERIDKLLGYKTALVPEEETETALAAIVTDLETVQAEIEATSESDIGSLGIYNTTIPALQEVISLIDTIKNSTVEDLVLKVKTEGLPGVSTGDTDSSSTSAGAYGITGARSGQTLVNELGPELISENGKAYIANGGKPAIVDLQQGAIVLNADETREALKGRSINSLAGGTGIGDIGDLIEDIRDKLFSFADEYNKSGNGNVDALGRPHVSKSKASALAKDEAYSSYWKNFSGDYANTYSSGFVIGSGKNKYSIEVTPILANGEILTQEGLEDYVYSLVTDNGIDGVINSDDLNLVMNVMPGDWDSSYWDNWFDNLAPVKDSLLETINQLYNIATIVAGSGNESDFLSQFGINTTGLDEAMQDLNDIWGIEIPEKDVDVVANTDSARKNLDSIQSYTIGDKTFTVTATTSGLLAKLLEQYGDEDENGEISQFASGTSNAKRGKALVNEEGPELISENGEAYIANNGKPAVVDLDAGAVVLNAKETADALSQNNKKRIQAFASGTKTGNVSKTTNAVTEALKKAQALQKKVEEAYSAAQAKKSTIGVTESTSSSSSGSSSSSSSDEETWFEKQYKYHQYLLKMDQESISDYLTWLNNAYKQAYNEGIIELDDYYKYAEEVYSKLQEDFKDYLNDREFSIEMLEHQEGNTSKIAALYKQLMVDVRSQINEAYAAGLSDTDDYVQELWQQWWDYYDDLDDMREDAKDDAEDQIDSLVDYRIDMLKQQLEDEKESYDDRLSLLKDFIDRQKEMLQDDADEEDYLKEQAEKRKEVADLEAEMAQLEYDNSAWAQKRKLELQEELTEAREDLQEFERDHAIEMAEDELDAIYELAEQSTEEQTDAIDEQLNNAQTLYEQALEDVKNNSQELYDEMVAYELKYGSGTAEAIEEMWTDAYKALQTYMDLFGEYYKGIELKNLTNYTQETIDTTNPAGSSSNYTAPVSLSDARSESTTTTSTATSAPSLTKGSYVDVKSGTKWYADSTGGGAWGWASGGTIKYINENGSHPYNINGAGWVRKEDIVGYAQGTSSATAGLHSFDEDGSEYLFSSSDGNKYKLFNSGDKVLSARAAQFLYDFANAGAGLSGLTSGMNSSIGAISSAGMTASFVMGDIVIQGNADMDTVSEIRRAQRDNMDYILKQLNKLNR